MVCHHSVIVAALTILFSPPILADELPGTKPLAAKGDFAAQMVDGMHKYLDRELAASVKKRAQFWKPDYSSPEAYTKSVEPNRERLKKILGVVDPRIPKVEMEYIATTSHSALVAEGKDYKVYAVRWPVLEGVDGEGLLLEPKPKPVGNVVAIPDADWTPEMLVGLAPGVPTESQFARRLAENRCRVLVPTLIDRKDTWSGNPKVRMTNQSHREFIYRMAYQNGRHIIGYEVQKVLAAVDWFKRIKDHPTVPKELAGYNDILRLREAAKQLPIAVWGHGEGGLVALYSGAIDEGIDDTAVSGYFGTRESLWREPIYRNVWDVLRRFGDTETASLILPRILIIDACKGPELAGPRVAKNGRFAAAAPGEIVPIPRKDAELEAERVRTPIAKIHWYDDPIPIAGRIMSVEDERDAGRESRLKTFLSMFMYEVKLKPPGDAPADLRKNLDPAVRQKRQFDQLVAYSQKLMRESDARRAEFFRSKLDTSSPEKYNASVQKFRNYLWEEVWGKLPKSTLPANPRTRVVYDEPKWTGYEVMLDLYPDVFCYGVLCVPKDLKPDEKRPVVVCQHGLEGTPRVVVDRKEKSVYNSFGAQLADRGYIVYAPQNPYRGGNNFRQLNRKANPLGLSMFSFILAQHERTLDWLATLPFVDPERVAFYGLSYGGETALRVPPLLPRYKLSICSADFNYFPWKTCTLDFAASYMLVNTYEIFDFNLNNTFSHAEMAALMAPRPFMVERGHDDGVGLDEWVAYEYAKVRRLYAKLKIPERTQIEFFDGGHEIHGKGTFAFLEKHLGWPPK
jgi:cephalosporin-C deacetylase-like acetyl esterase